MPGDPPLTPPIDNSRNPPLHEMDWARFERLTADLYAEEPGVVATDEYGTAGQADYGADVLARLNDGRRDAVSCKRREQASAADISAWSAEFLEHWHDRWSKRKIRKFVLATTAKNTSITGVQDQIASEEARFAALGVAFELWGPNQFVQKLRPHRGLTSQYLGPVWAETICGPPAASAGVVTQAGPSPLTALVTAQLAELQERLSDEAARRAELALDDLRSGDTKAVRALILELKAPAFWGQIQAAARAQVLRLEASLALRDGDPDTAEKLDGEAEAEVPDAERRLAAQIALDRHGVDEALAVLGKPVSVRGNQLLATLLLQNGDLEEAGSVITDLQTGVGDHAETLRLAALLALFENKRHEAFSLIRRAEEIAPAWLAIRQAGAIVRYALALSPAATPEWFLYPNPVDRSLVREDAVSVVHLEAALDLVDGSLSTAPIAVRKEADLWCLAILANLRHRHDDVLRLAARLLSNRPDDPTIVAWCVTRHYDVDLEPSRIALERGLGPGTGQMQVRVLGLLYASGEDRRSGADTLRNALPTLSEDAREEATTWIERLDGSAAPSSENEEAGEGARAAAAIRAARDNDNWSLIPAVLNELLGARPPHYLGLDVAEFVAFMDRWDLLEGRIDALLAYETATATRLAAFASSRLDDHGRVLSIIEEHASAFGTNLPLDMRRLRADALARTGQIRDAIHEADTVLASTRTTADMMFRAELLVGAGDIQSSIPAVRSAAREGALQPAHALRWAGLLAQDEPELARELWRAAIATGLEDRLVAAAMVQAFQLGLDNEASVLMPKVQERAAAGNGDVRLVTIDDLPDMMARYREDDEKVHELYLFGALPAHSWARDRFDAFLRLHLGADEGGQRLLLKPIRHGGRPLACNVDAPWNEWRIHLDVSGLLQAWSLGLLDHLERHPQGIAIPAAVPAILIEMQRAVRPAQPSRADAIRRVLAQIDKGDIIVVEMTPPNALVIAERHGPATPGTASLTELLDVCARAGIELEDRPDLGVAANAPDRSGGLTSLDTGQTILLADEAVEAAIGSSLFDDLAGSFALALHAEQVERMRMQVAHAAEGERLAAAAGTIRQRVAQGLESGVYRMLEAPAADQQTMTLLETSLREVIRAGPTEGGVVWIDDRFVSGYSRTDSMPVIGIVDVIFALHAQGQLSADERDGKMAALRAAGAAFIPFAADEVHGPLIAAAVRSGRIVENRRLTGVRRAFAANTQIEGKLKVGEAEGILHDRPDEYQQVQSTMRLLGETLELIWQEPSLDVDRRYACSDWLWTNLRATRINRDIPAPDPGAAQDFFEVMQIGHLLDKALDVGGYRDERETLRLEYCNWCWQRIVRPKAVADPTFQKRLASYLVDFYSALIRDHRATPAERDRRIMDRLVLLRIERLPTPIKDEVFGNRAFRRFVTIRQNLRVGGATFEPERFWRAATAALRYGRSKLRTQEGRKVRIRAEDGQLVITGALRARVVESFLPAAAAREKDRAQAIVEYLRTLELDNAATGSAEDDALAARSPGQIAQVLAEARGKSVRVGYLEVEGLLRRGAGFHIGKLAPPPADRFRRFLRTDGEGASISDRLATARPELARDLGIAPASDRLRSLPVIPADTANATEPDVLARAARSARTPVAICTTVTGLRRVKGGTAEVAAGIARFVDAVVTWGPLFGTLLRWTYRRYFNDATWRGLEAADKLALCWAHADMLLHVFIRVNADPDPIAKFLDENATDVSGPDVFAMMEGCASDVAMPGRMTIQRLLYHGLGAMLDGDDMSIHMTPGLIERIRFILLVSTDAGTTCHPSIMMRPDPASNALGSFMGEDLAGLDSEGPDQVRQDLLERALANLEHDIGDFESGWQAYAAFSSSGVSDAQYVRLKALLDQVDPMLIGPQGPSREFRLWRVVTVQMACRDPAWTMDWLTKLSSTCSRRFGGQVRQRGAADHDPHATLHELVECAALLAAAAEPSERDGTFASACRAIARTWPGAAPFVRNCVENLLAATVASRAEVLWRLSLDLRTCR